MQGYNNLTSATFHPLPLTKGIDIASQKAEHPCRLYSEACRFITVATILGPSNGLIPSSQMAQSMEQPNPWLLLCTSVHRCVSMVVMPRVFSSWRAERIIGTSIYIRAHCERKHIFRCIGFGIKTIRWCLVVFSVVNGWILELTAWQGEAHGLWYVPDLRGQIFSRIFAGMYPTNVMKAHVFQEYIHVIINHFATVLLVCCYLLAVEENIQLREIFPSDVWSV